MNAPMFGCVLRISSYIEVHAILQGTARATHAPYIHALTLRAPAVILAQFQYTHWWLQSSFPKMFSWQVKTLVPIPNNQTEPQFSL